MGQGGLFFRRRKQRSAFHFWNETNGVQGWLLILKYSTPERLLLIPSRRRSFPLQFMIPMTLLIITFIRDHDIHFAVVLLLQLADL